MIRTLSFITTAILFFAGANSTLGAASSGDQPSALTRVTLSSDNGQVTRMSLQPGTINRTESLTGQMPVERLAIEEEAATVKPGWPELPMVSRMVLVPPTADVQLVVHQIDSRVESGFSPFIAPQQSESIDLDASGAPASAYLNYDGFWPPEPVVVGEPAILRGYRLVQVTTFPVQVNPRTSEVKYNDNIDFELTYSGVGKNIIQNADRPRPSSSIEKVIASLVVNPPAPQRDSALPQRGSYLLVYLNTNGMANALAPLIAWRSRMGWEVHTLAMAANSTASQIKQRIQTAYNEWANPPEMIALVGDPDWNGNGIPYFNANAGGMTDLEYAQLEGNDILADADYGRISAMSMDELNRVVGKIVNYESDPYMQDVEWYRHGMVCAGASVSGLSTILVNKWVRREAMDRGWTGVDQWYFNAPFNNQDVPTFFRTQFARGISFATYRGWVGMENLDANSILNWNATRRMPYATTLTCASGHFGGQRCNTEAFFVSAGGAIGSIGFATTSTHVPYNNAVFTGIWVGVFKKGLYALGTNSNYGRYNLYRQYHGFEEDNVTNFSKWANLMGDPATEMFTDVPVVLAVTHPEILPVGGSRVTITVRDDGQTPVADATVCLFKSSDEYQQVVTTNADGVAEFTISPEALTSGDLLVTVTKHNVKPYLGTITVGEADDYVGLYSSRISADNNNDGMLNVGEGASLDLSLRNYSQNAVQGGLTVHATSLSRWLSIAVNDAQINQGPQAGENVDASLGITADISAPDGAKAQIALDISDGQSTWSSMAEVEFYSPKPKIDAIFLPNNRFNPGDIVDLDIGLSNIGRAALEPSNVHIWVDNSSVSAVRSEASYPEIDTGAVERIDGIKLRLRAHPFTVPGTKVTLHLALETIVGFRDTLSTVITVGAPRETDPFGPDSYGYVCFDSGDESWEMAPTYDWVEIDPNVEGHAFVGTLTRLRDTGEDNDMSIVMDLPFQFQYYGEMQTQITICTNGWAAFGDWSELSDFRNRRIATGECADKQLAVFWDDLTTGRVLVYYDEEGNRLIVEWNGMRSLADNSAETFQLILLGTDAAPSYTGDGTILYQYKDIRNVAGAGPSNDTPYATIGIGNLDDTDGLEYTYYNTYATGAKHLENRLAIKFTTAVQYITGIFKGVVTEAATGLPIAGVDVTTPRGFWAATNDLGEFRIDDILIGDYSGATFHKLGYNDSTWTGFNGRGFTIRENDSVEVAMSLLQPHFELSSQDFQHVMLKDSTTADHLTLANNGDGTLWYKSKFIYAAPDSGRDGPARGERGMEQGLPGRDDQWRQLLSWNASDSTQNMRFQSLAYINGIWLMAAGHVGQGDNRFYEFTKEGAYSGVNFVQPTSGSYGIRDMEVYQNQLWGTFPDSSWIMQIDPVTGADLAHYKLPSGFNNARNLAIDPRTGHFWASGITSRLYELALVPDSGFAVLNIYRTTDPRNQTEIHEYGLAWFRDDPDNFNIYLISSDEDPADPNNLHPNISLYKMNPLNGDTRYLTDLRFPNPTASAKGGMVITPKWNNGVYALATLFDITGGADQVGIFELAPNSSWIDYTPRSDTLLYGEQLDIEVSINSADLDTGSYWITIQFDHNADDGIALFPINLNVVMELPNVAVPGEAPLPLDYALNDAYPNPFNSRTIIGYSLRDAGRVRLDVFDLSGRLVTHLIDRHQEAGRFQIALDAAELPAGLYFYRLNAGAFSASKKLLLVK